MVVVKNGIKNYLSTSNSDLYLHKYFTFGKMALAYN